MQLQINEDYRIRTDSMNVTVEQRKVKEKGGEEYWVQVSFHNTLAQALHWFVNHSIRINQETELNGIMEAIEAIHRDIEMTLAAYKEM